jgi:hypothetical protein
VSTQVQYYALVTAGPGGHGSSGLARRTFEPDGPVDETLLRDLTWAPDSAVVEWEYGDLSAEVIPISAQDAERLEETFRARWTR